MNKAVYLSTVFKWWTLPRQEEVLKPFMDRAAVYRDILDTGTRRSYIASDFAERSSMLRPSSRRTKRTIYVASPAVLAQKEADFREVVAEVLRQGIKLIPVADGATEPISDVESAVAAWRAARAQSRLEGASKRGGQATKAKFEALIQDNAEMYREQWGDPRFETKWIMEKVGVKSLNTMNKYMGKTRRAAIRESRARLQAQAARQRRKSKEQVQ